MQLLHKSRVNVVSFTCTSFFYCGIHNANKQHIELLLKGDKLFRKANCKKPLTVNKWIRLVFSLSINHEMIKTNNVLVRLSTLSFHTVPNLFVKLSIYIILLLIFR